MVRSQDRYFSCKRKHKYHSYNLANDAMSLLAYNTDQSIWDLNVYSCKYCGFFHVGHKLVYRKKKSVA